VTNQPPPLDEFDPLACDPVLGAAISRTAVWCLRSRTSCYPTAHVTASDPSPERARRLAVLITLCLQASLLVQHSPAVVAEAFLGSRFGGDVPGWTSLPARSDTRLLVERVTHRWDDRPQPG
jgi:hypothetical protein